MVSVNNLYIKSFNIKRAKVGKRTSVQADFFKTGHWITVNVGMMLPDIH